MRTRDLKPGFFRDLELTELPHVTRLLYAGLWCFVDKRGRCEDNPKLIKADIFPYENVPVEKHLKLLEEHSFIRRYEVGGRRFIWVIRFRAHQHPHPKEQESTYPPAPDDDEPGYVPNPHLGTSQPAPRSGSDPASTSSTSSSSVPSGSSKPSSTSSPPTPEEVDVLVNAQNIYRVAERAFGRGMKPGEVESLREFEDEYTEGVWRYAFREAVELNKVSIRYIRAVCVRAAKEGIDDNRESHNGNGSRTSQRPAPEDDRPVIPVHTINLNEPYHRDLA